MRRHTSTQRDHHRLTVPVSGWAVNFPAGHIRPLHHHSAAQLIYAVDGVMVVSSETGQWVVPPTQAIWMPAYTAHTVRMVNAVTMRTLYIQPDAATGLPDRCHTVAISELLRQLILNAMDITSEYTADSRDGRLMGLLLDELNFLPVLPLHLPLPTHQYLVEICQQILDTPDDKRTLREWAQVVGVDPKTVQRTFSQQVGLTFGQWRKQARLLMALERLATGQSVLDVALSMGYDSPSAFTAMFKKQLGVVPSEYFRTGE
jgi:AraC-like DNA-binding protein/mannose-6-phosphate isomerase-like protein (cupin superfamily)